MIFHGNQTPNLQVRPWLLEEQFHSSSSRNNRQKTAVKSIVKGYLKHSLQNATQCCLTKQRKYRTKRLYPCIEAMLYYIAALFGHFPNCRAKHDRSRQWNRRGLIATLPRGIPGLAFRGIRGFSCGQSRINLGQLLISAGMTAEHVPCPFPALLKTGVPRNLAKPQ